MRVRLIIRDKEYCRALATEMASFSRSIFVEVVIDGNWGHMDDKTLIVTDVDYRRIEPVLLNKYRDRIIFLTSNPEDVLTLADNAPYCIFKYRSVGNLISDFIQVNYLLTGETLSTGNRHKVACVCSDTLVPLSANVSQTLARQMLFHKGGHILALSLNYINEFGTDDEVDNSRYSRLMYYLDIGRGFSIEAFTYQDSYGISYLRLPKGLNPIAFMSPERLIHFIDAISCDRFDVVVLSIGSCYSESNINAVNIADYTLFLSEGGSRFDVGELIKRQTQIDGIYRIHMGISSQDIELRIDDYVRRIYRISDPIE